MQRGALDSGAVEAGTERGELTPALVVRAPEALRGGRFELGKAEQSVGRSEASDIRLDDPYVSRRHAWIRCAGRAVIVEDADSSAGVVVNDVPAAGPTLLHNGDRLRLGAVELELVNGPKRAAASRAGDSTAVYAAPATPAPPPPAPPPPPERRFDIADQHARSISNVAGDQYNQYELRIAPMRRRARHLMRVGAVIFIAGLVAFGVGFAAFARPLVECDFNDPSGCAMPDVKGWAVGALGTFISLAGLIVIAIAVFMRRKARREEEKL